MWRSRRVYQAPQGSDIPTESDVGNGDSKCPTKTIGNNDPKQPLTGPHQGSVSDYTQQQNGKTINAESSSDSEETDDSSVFTRCFCCWRQRTNTVVGEFLKCRLSK